MHVGHVEECCIVLYRRRKVPPISTCAYTVTELLYKLISFYSETIFLSKTSVSIDRTFSNKVSDGPTYKLIPRSLC